jgi:hypothetical protein
MNPNGIEINMDDTPLHDLPDNYFHQLEDKSIGYSNAIYKLVEDNFTETDMNCLCFGFGIFLGKSIVKEDDIKGFCQAILQQALHSNRGWNQEQKHEN